MDGAQGPDEGPPGMPAWVKALVGLLVLGLAIVVILHMTGAAPSGH